MLNAAQDQNSLEERLARVGVFHQDDLDANEAGHLSEAQKHWLALEAAFWLGLAGLETGLSATMWIFYLLHPSESLLFAALGWGVFLVLSALMCFGNGRAILAEREEDQVKTVSGMLLKHFSVRRKRSSLGERGAVTCSIEIHNQLFRVSPSTYDAIIEGLSYRLFYLPKNHTLVNIVPLFTNPDKHLGAS